MSDSDDSKMPAPREQDVLVTRALLKESDRGCVILGAALLADALEALLRAFFRQAPADAKQLDGLFEGYAPLATFSAKIQVAYALAILPRDLRDKIEIVRRLRNDFAHDWGPLDFDDPRCRDRLAVVAEYPVPDSPQFLRMKDEMRAHADGHLLLRRLEFTLVVAKIIGHLEVLSERAREGLDIRQAVLHGEPSI